mmetsp:Transcript_4459/g.8225  ORF Transcript_4459/g.8225 Transcript_4459/m.8225 type:complete len:96 (-) Transcript_4459:938-1225(-)
MEKRRNVRTDASRTLREWEVRVWRINKHPNNDSGLQVHKLRDNLRVAKFMKQTQYTSVWYTTCSRASTPNVILGWRIMQLKKPNLSFVVYYKVNE